MIQYNFYEVESFYLDALVELGVNGSDVRRLGEQDLACRCPVCGDSRHSENKKRLHLYQKDKVLNVNCFNGDCPVKNLTVWSFFKTYTPRIFNQFQAYHRHKYLDKIIEGSRDFPGREDSKSHGMEEMEFDWSSVPEVMEVPGSEQPSKMERFIEGFQKGPSRKRDLQRIKDFLSENPGSLEDLKLLIGT